MKNSSRLQNLTPDGLALVAGRFRLLSEPLRLQILNRLQAGETSVSQLAEDIGTSQPNVSKHLRLLIEGGLVARRQEKTSVFVRVADPCLEPQGLESARPLPAVQTWACDGERTQRWRVAALPPACAPSRWWRS